MISPPRNEVLVTSQVQTEPAEQAERDDTVSELIRQEVVPENQVPSVHLPVYLATSPRRSQRGLKRRAPPEDEVWY